MKIMFAIKALDNIKGGAERVLTDVASGLAAKGHDVTVLSFDRPGGSAFYPLHQDIKRISLGIGDVGQRTSFSEAVKRIFSLRRAIAPEKPDVVVAFMHSMFIPAAFAMTASGIPVIASEHIVPQHYKKRKLEFFLLILAGLMARRMTVLSEGVRELYPAILRPRMEVIPNPVLTPAAGAPYSKDSKIILNVGRLDPQKDQETLIRAFSLLAKAHPDWNLRIVGEGDLKEYLAKQIAALNLEDRITLVGGVKDVDAEYRRAGIFAMPSLYESFGLATVEAMSYGIPAVGFVDCPGTNEIIVDGQNGLLADGADRAGAFAAKLETLIGDAELRSRLGQGGVETARQYAPPKIIEKWEALITACARG